MSVSFQFIIRRSAIKFLFISDYEQPDLWSNQTSKNTHTHNVQLKEHTQINNTAVMAIVLLPCKSSLMTD